MKSFAALNGDCSKLELSLLEKIGNTPLLKLEKLTKDCAGVDVYAKAEWYNPGGSVKARPALQMINDGERSGELSKNKIIIDSTSGNTGVAYALIGYLKKYEVELVMPANVVKERKGIMASLYHAKIIKSDPMEGSDGAIRLAHAIVEKSPEKYFMPDQYNNPSNWKAHYHTTAKEIIKQTNGTVTHFVSGIGTGGTIMGTGQGLKYYDSNIKVYAVEPGEALHGIEGLKHMESSIIPEIYDLTFPDETIPVKTEEAYAMVDRLKKEEGLSVGQSSGAAMVGVLQLAKRIKKGVIVTVFPDGWEGFPLH